MVSLLHFMLLRLSSSLTSSNTSSAHPSLNQSLLSFFSIESQAVASTEYSEDAVGVTDGDPEAESCPVSSNLVDSDVNRSNLSTIALVRQDMMQLVQPIEAHVKSSLLWIRKKLALINRQSSDEEPDVDAKIGMLDVLRLQLLENNLQEVCSVIGDIMYELNSCYDE